MAETRWTPSMVEERLVEAADVLKRLPEVRVQGYFSTWPPIVREAAEAYGWDTTHVCLGPPSPAAIDRMDEALEWLRWLDPEDARIVWLRASGERWKAICWKVGLQRATAHEHWLYALCVIAWRLNGRRIPGKRSRRHVISLVREADARAL